MSRSGVRHGQAAAAAGASHSVPMELLSQYEDRVGCDTTTAWSPTSPTLSACDLLSTSFSDAIQEAAVLSKPTMHRPSGYHAADYHRHRHSNSSAASTNRSNSNSALKTEPTQDAAMMATSAYELDHDMMGMLANNWNLNAGPPRANWGFEPTHAETQALYDPLMTSSNQQAALPGSMMMTLSEMTNLMGMTGAMTSNESTMAQPLMGSVPDAFVDIDNGYVMPYQDSATLPVHDFSVYDNEMYKAANPAGIPQATLAVDTTFQDGMGSSNETTLFNEVAQPPAASMAAINGGFAMPDLSLQEDDDSDWNGSSSGFSTVSSSPMANNMNPMSSTSESRTTKPSTRNKDGSRKPKRIRRLCSVGGCGKRARSQDLCIAHGGGRRCMMEGCEKSSQGGNMCIKHGGGKRCKHPGCDKAAQTNSLCKAHGGGPRCQYPSCTKSSQGGGFCRAHGGGKRCAAEWCNKGTQRGDFCALHGGSRFCEIPGCVRNDRGGGFCAHHGGGKRCVIANCNRSCRRDGLCSTHLRLLGQESGSATEITISAAIPGLSEARGDPGLTVDTPGIMANILDAASL